MRESLLILIVCGVWTGQALSQTTWSVAPGPSSVTFNVQHLVFSHVEGSFRTFWGSVITEKADFSDAQIDAIISVASIYTGHQDRDNHLRGNDFFDAAHYPAIRFKSTSFKKTGEHTYEIIGALTIRDVTRIVELDATSTDPRVISRGRKRVDFTVNGSLNRYDYGLRWNDVFGADKLLIGKMIGLTLNIALIREI